VCRYSDETGGDYYDFIDLEEIKPGKVSIALGDITGHGVGAALLMASARGMLRNDIRHYRDDLSRILFEFNNELTKDTDPDKFITLFLGMLDDQSRSLIWATGGHDPALWYKKQQDIFEELKSIGVPIGFVAGVNFEKAGPVLLEKGDLVVIGTDGIWEAVNPGEEMFGKERLTELIKANCEKSAQEICQIIVQTVLEFCGSRAPEDDITVVVIKGV
jgi:sigma-B regulation protein RsbU (phosphoserine phosphatase)